MDMCDHGICLLFDKRSGMKMLTITLQALHSVKAVGKKKKVETFSFLLNSTYMYICEGIEQWLNYSSNCLENQRRKNQ